MPQLKIDKEIENRLEQKASNLHTVIFSYRLLHDPEFFEVALQTAESITEMMKKIRDENIGHEVESDG